MPFEVGGTVPLIFSKIFKENSFQFGLCPEVSPLVRDLHDFKGNFRDIRFKSLVLVLIQDSK